MVNEDKMRKAVRTAITERLISDFVTDVAEWTWEEYFAQQGLVDDKIEAETTKLFDQVYKEIMDPILASLRKET